MNRSQVLLTMRRLQAEGLVQYSGRLRQTRWHLKSGSTAVSNANLALPMQHSHTLRPHRSNASPSTNQGHPNLEQLKLAILNALARGPMSNANLRQLTQMNRHKTLRLMRVLEANGAVKVIGSRKAGHWSLAIQPQRKA